MAAAFDAATLVSSGIELVNARAGAALAAARDGRTRDARAFLRLAEEGMRSERPPTLHTVVYLAHAYKALGDRSRALALLERHTPRRDLHFQLHLRCDPPFDALRDVRRFRALLVRPAPARGVGC